jgi:hypothetical protein
MKLRTKIFFFILLLIPIFALAQNSSQISYLYRDLEFGMSGEDVKLLQSWLAIHKGIYPEGLITGYFGKLTEAAVKRYQEGNNIVKTGNPISTGYGRVGPITRASLNSTFLGKTFGISWQEGYSKYAIFLDGGFLEATSVSVLNLKNNSEFTIEVWIKPSKLTYRKALIIGKGLVGDVFNYGIGIEQKGKIFARHLEGDIVTDKAYVKEGEWQRIAVTFKKGKNLFYYNGKLVEEKSDFNFNEFPNNFPLTIGISKEKETGNLGEAFLGAIDEIKIYKGSFQKSEISILEMSFDEGRGITTTDKINGINFRLKIGKKIDILPLQPPEPIAKEKIEKEEEKEEKEEEKEKIELPKVDLKVNNSDGPIQISYNDSIILSWTSTNASSCQASGDWSGQKSLSGSESIKNLTSSKTFNLTCIGPGGSTTDSVIVNVSLPYYHPTPPPSCQYLYPSGSQTYSVTTKTIPKIYQIIVNPLNVGYLASQTVSASINDANGNPITSVTGFAITDNKTTPFNLTLVSGSEINGVWEGSWNLTDSICQRYQVKIQAQSESGTSHVTLTFK